VSPAPAKPCWREVAKALGAPLLTWHIKSTTKAQQGLYEYDAVSRLRDSQLGDARVSDISNYIKRGKLWEAFTHEKRPVLLIDEIDKADIEFPKRSSARTRSHGVLRLRDRREHQGEAAPIVMITSNNEKELPDAFCAAASSTTSNFPMPTPCTGSSTCISRHQKTPGGRSVCGSFSRCGKCPA